MSDVMWMIGGLVISFVLFIAGYLIGSRRKNIKTDGAENAGEPALKEELDRVVGERDDMRNRLSELTGTLVDLREAESARETELADLRNESVSQSERLETMRTEHEALVTATEEMRRTNKDLAKASSMQEQALAETTTLLKTLMGQLQMMKEKREQPSEGLVPDGDIQPEPVGEADPEGEPESEPIEEDTPDPISGPEV